MLTAKERTEKLSKQLVQLLWEQYYSGEFGEPPHLVDTEVCCSVTGGILRACKEADLSWLDKDVLKSLIISELEVVSLEPSITENVPEGMHTVSWGLEDDEIVRVAENLEKAIKSKIQGIEI